ncbi:hypothetical protein SORBI_3005G110439 [Sorghum bicolor]|uniref:Uncharacterized protein n=1 Tax=Sorghum bicolor TaxID=4558 RepID=A0A125QUK2_SORBI|nr:hypothetical protein SORBI_3005G110439 [Sorghum bicolor]OQU83352.1 hypothetical protein SORBI_3005G110439 [Sorghum bicolor]
MAVPHDAGGDRVKSARASPPYSPIQQTLISPLRSCSAPASGGARHRRAAAAARAGGRQPGVRPPARLSQERRHGRSAERRCRGRVAATATC